MSFDIAKVLGQAAGHAVETGLSSFLGGEEQKDNGGKDNKGGFSFGKLFSSGGDGNKDVHEGSPSGGQTDEDNRGFGLSNALTSGGGDEQKDPDNGGLGPGNAKGGGQKNDDPGIDAAADALGEFFDQ